MEILIFVLFYMVCLSLSFPQYVPPSQNFWRNYPQYTGTIPAENYYSDHPSEFVDPTVVKPLANTRMDYHSVRLTPKSGGPAQDLLPDPITNIKTPVDTDQITTRILNYRKNAPNLDTMMMSDQNSDFVFPGSVNIRRSSSSTKKPPITQVTNNFLPDPSLIEKNCDENATFCYTRENYPSEHIRRILKENKENFEDYFGTDELVSVNITTRIGVSDEGTPMCDAFEQVIQPPVAKNKDDQWKFIVNDGNYVQGIRVEMCRNPGKPCAMSDNFPLSYTTECKQKYIFRKLLAVESSGLVQTDNFRLPSCCVCVYKPSRVIRSIFGLNPK